MSTRIRLQRHGKKGKPVFHLVVADSKAKRDGRFIEKLGTYNPNTNPATIDISFERTLHWVQTGAEQSETARALLSYKGVLMMDHLMRGVAKGALTEEQAKAKFDAWTSDKENKVEAKKSGLSKAAQDDIIKRLEAEKAVSAAREAARQPEPEVVEEAPAEEVAEAPATEEAAPTEETSTEEPKAE
jgi:small subunit ribosomal protein S16